jgi:predicted MFS family arabinose efflux permease
VHRLCGGAVGLSHVRDQLTRAAYASFAFWGWFLYAFGPAVPLIRDDQGTSRAVAGLHGTALALGTILSASISVPLVHRFQRRGTLVGATALAAVGVVVLVVGPGPAVTLLGALLTGVGGGVVLNAVNPVLSDHHGPVAPAAISEANALAAGCGIVAPLAVGLGVDLGLTWRAAILVSLPLAALSIVLVLRAPLVPALVEEQRPQEGPRSPLGRPFWLALGLVVAAVGMEFCTTFWGSELLRSRDGLSPGAASAGVSALLAGMTLGRLAAVPLSRRFSSRHILLATLALTGAGWATFWLARSAPLALTGLVLLGFGLAFSYPIGVVLLMQGSGGRPDTAIALAGLGVGVASGSAPFALGAMADRVGTHNGFLLVPALLVVAVACVLLARPAAGRAQP